MQIFRSEKPTLAHPSTALLDSIPEYLQSIQTPEFWLQMEQAVQLLIQAERIFVIGLRTAIGAATVFENEISQLTGNVFQLSNTQEMIFDRAMDMTHQDILVVFSNWPYTKRTIDVANFVSAKGIPFILETNLSDHPLRDRAAAVLNSNSVNLPYHTLPSILVVELLVYELRCHIQPKVDRQLPETERLLDSLGIEIFEHQRQR